MSRKALSIEGSDYIVDSVNPLLPMRVYGIWVSHVFTVECVKPLSRREVSIDLWEIKPGGKSMEDDSGASELRTVVSVHYYWSNVSRSYCQGKGAWVTR
jgi:hypothetical protein